MKCFPRFTSRRTSKCDLTGLLHCSFEALIAMFERQNLNKSLFWQINTLSIFNWETCSLDFFWNGSVCFGNASVLFGRYLVNLSKKSSLTDRGLFYFAREGSHQVGGEEKNKRTFCFFYFYFISPEIRVGAPVNQNI